MHTHPPLSRLLAIATLAAALATSGSLWSADASGTTRPHVEVGGFAGAVTGPPRPIDRDVEGSPAALRPVPCRSGDAMVRCWIR